MVSEGSVSVSREPGFGSMSKKERLAASLDRITDLCFTISELGIGEGSEEEDAGPPSSSLSAGAPVFTPAREDLPSTSGIRGSLSSLTISDDWQSVPEFPSVGTDTPPSFCQVVGGSQSVYVTPIRRARAQSVDSVSSVMAAPPARTGRHVLLLSLTSIGITSPVTPRE